MPRHHLGRTGRGGYGAGLSPQLVRIRVLKYRVYLEKDEDRVNVARFPGLPGCGSERHTCPEATANIREAMEGYLASLRAHGDPVRPRIQEEIIEVAG